MPSTTIRGAAALAIASAALVVQFAPAQTSWDRRAEQVFIVPQPGDPPGTYRIGGAWSAEAFAASLLNLNTKVTFSINGTAVGSQSIGVTASALGDCDFCPPPNTCVCAEPSGPCSCGALTFTTAHPVPVALAAGDVVTISLAPGTGGVAEQNTANDSKSRTFVGQPIFWNRRLLSAEVAPACQGGADLYDIHFNLSVDLAAMDGEIPLGWVLAIVVNGVPHSEFDACGDDPWIAYSTSCIFGGSCVSDACGTGSCAGANVDLDCNLVEIHGGAAETCACSSGPLNYVIPGVAIAGLTPSTQVKCALVPKVGKFLPEVPALADDDTVAAALKLPGPPCAADLNGDGEVNGADLGLVLSAWGPCDPR